MVDHYSRYQSEFETEEEFQRTRNMFGDLVILPKDINRSLNDDVYSKKLEKYYSQNLLVASLNEMCYKNNPNFLRFVEKHSLSFKAENSYTKQTIISRQLLYEQLARLIWDVNKINDLAK